MFNSATYVTGSVVELLGDREWAMLVSVAIGEALISLQAFLFPDWRNLMRVQAVIVMAVYVTVESIARIATVAR